ncbi:MAG: sigma factor-like helix-turn-helix DNA-binding protein, partial [Patescibacteria group bacterium]
MKWEVKDRIVKACVNLSSRQQNVVEMRAIDGKSFPEIGSELGITKERASHLYQQGRLKLLSSLRDLRDVI